MPVALLMPGAKKSKIRFSIDSIVGKVADSDDADGIDLSQSLKMEERCGACWTEHGELDNVSTENKVLPCPALESSAVFTPQATYPIQCVPRYSLGSRGLQFAPSAETFPLRADYPLRPCLPEAVPRDYLFYPWLLTRHRSMISNPFLLPNPDSSGFFLQPWRKPKRIRTAFTPGQLLKLEQAFEKNHYVVGSERKQLAVNLTLSETQVKVWFQNRRTKHKRVQHEEDPKLETDSDLRPKHELTYD